MPELEPRARAPELWRDMARKRFGFSHDIGHGFGLLPGDETNREMCRRLVASREAPIDYARGRWWRAVARATKYRVTVHHDASDDPHADSSARLLPRGRRPPRFLSPPDDDDDRYLDDDATDPTHLLPFIPPVSGGFSPSSGVPPPGALPRGAVRDGGRPHHDWSVVCVAAKTRNPAARITDHALIVDLPGLTNVLLARYAHRRNGGWRVKLSVDAFVEPQVPRGDSAAPGSSAERSANGRGGVRRECAVEKNASANDDAENGKHIGSFWAPLVAPEWFPLGSALSRPRSRRGADGALTETPARLHVDGVAFLSRHAPSAYQREYFVRRFDVRQNPSTGDEHERVGQEHPRRETNEAHRDASAAPALARARPSRSLAHDAASVGGGSISAAYSYSEFAGAGSLVRSVVAPGAASLPAATVAAVCASFCASLSFVVDDELDAAGGYGAVARPEGNAALSDEADGIALRPKREAVAEAGADALAFYAPDAMPATTAPATRVPAPLPYPRRTHASDLVTFRFGGDAPARASRVLESVGRARGGGGGGGGGGNDDDATRARAAETNGAVRSLAARSGGRVACHLVFTHVRGDAHVSAMGLALKEGGGARAAASNVPGDPGDGQGQGQGAAEDASHAGEASGPIPGPGSHLSSAAGSRAGAYGAVFELKDSDGFAADDDDGREWDFFPANAENRADAEGAGAKPRTCVRLRSAVVAVGHSILVTVPFSALVEAARGGEGGEAS